MKFLNKFLPIIFLETKNGIYRGCLSTTNVTDACNVYKEKLHKLNFNTTDCVSCTDNLCNNHTLLGNTFSQCRKNILYKKLKIFFRTVASVLLHWNVFLICMIKFEMKLFYLQRTMLRFWKKLVGIFLPYLKCNFEIIFVEDPLECYSCDVEKNFDECSEIYDTTEKTTCDGNKKVYSCISAYVKISG